MKNKFIAAALAIALLLSLLAFPASAASASVSISASGSVTLGSQVKVTIKISGSEKIGSWLFTLDYDPAYLEYVSGADSGGGGAVRFSDSVDSGVSSITKTVTFRAKKIGTAALSVSSPQIVGFDSLSNMSAGGASKKINVIAAPTLSSNNNLASLSISSGDLTPAFSASTTAYTASVPFEVTKLDVSAAAADKAAKVAVNGGELVVGENQIDVVITAENGKTKTYTITVTRQESELAGVVVQVDSKEFSVAYDPSTLTIPEGYTQSTVLFGEKKMLCYYAPQNSICIVYLVSEELSDWYLYSELDASFSPMQKLSSNASDYVILTPPTDQKIPDGFVPETILVGEKSVSVYQSSLSSLNGIYLVYAMAKDGSLGFYYFDSQLSSLVSYFEAKVPEKDVPVSVAPAQMEEANKTISELEIISLSLGIACVLLFVGLLLSLLLQRKKEKEEEIENEAIEKLPLTEKNEKTQVIDLLFDDQERNK